MRQLLPLLFIFTFFSAFVFAQVEPDFYAAAPATISVCSCGTADAGITVRNTGDFVTTYHLAQEGSAASYAALFPSSFVLFPGEELRVAELLSVPCGVKEKAALATTITTDLNVQKQFVQDIVLQQCRNIGVSAIQSALPECRCATFDYQLKIRNDGTFPETYSFRADGVAAVVVPSTIMLAPGEAADVFVYATPACDATGTNTFTVVTKALQNGIEEKTVLQFHADPLCYAQGAFVPVQLVVTANKTAANFTLSEFLPQQLLSFKPLIWLAVLPAALMVLLFLAALFRRAPSVSSEKKETVMKPKQEKPYQWEKLFREPMTVEPKNGRPAARLPQPKLQQNVPWGIIAVMAAVVVLGALLATATYFMLYPPAFTMNVTVTQGNEAGMEGISALMPSPKETVNATIDRPVADAKIAAAKVFRVIKKPFVSIAIVAAVVIAVAAFFLTKRRNVLASFLASGRQRQMRILKASLASAVLLAGVAVAAAAVFMWRKLGAGVFTAALGKAKAVFIGYLFYIVFGLVLLAIIIALLTAFRGEKAGKQQAAKPAGRKK